jgi:predicted nucleic acid-binding protein
VTFLDANVVIYAVGTAGTLRDAATAILDAAIDRPGTLVTDSEALQELLHVYTRREGIERAREVLAFTFGLIADGIEPVTASDVIAAANADLHPRLQARDRVHIAVMRRIGAGTIVTSDRGFDLVPGIRRLDPLQFDDWRDDVFASP